MTKPIWKKSNPRKRHRKMSKTEKAEAKRAARGHGRSRPSLVDNINAMRHRRKRSRTTDSP